MINFHDYQLIKSNNRGERKNCGQAAVVCPVEKGRI